MDKNQSQKLTFEQFMLRWVYNNTTLLKKFTFSTKTYKMDNQTTLFNTYMNLRLKLWLKTKILDTSQ